MSGVSLAKIRCRLFDTLTENLHAPILYYSGDGSQKSFFSPDGRGWIEDPSFARILSDAQVAAIIEPDRLEAALNRNGVPAGRGGVYYRGGSISWMILGDHAAQSYREPKAARAVRDLMQTTGLPPRRLIFAGNELYRGGNDNMPRAVKGMTLFSVGDRFDPGSTDAVEGRLIPDERERARTEPDRRPPALAGAIPDALPVRRRWRNGWRGQVPDWRKGSNGQPCLEQFTPAEPRCFPPTSSFPCSAP